MIESIRNKMKPFAVQIVPLLPKLYEDHVAIFEAFKAGVPEVAECAFRNHNRRLLEEIKESVKLEEIKKSVKSKRVPKDRTV